MLAALPGTREDTQASLHFGSSSQFPWEGTLLNKATASSLSRTLEFDDRGLNNNFSPF